VANSVLAKMAVQISANTSQFNAGLAQTNRSLSAFSSSLGAMAGTLAATFAVQNIANFALEVSKLAGEANGVKVAFDKLPESVKLMDELKRATAGTVSELELMRKSVQASNFGISLQALPKLLEFASVRAKQTGVSVDYLVDSIVTGIGRKSKLILDNLGISAVDLTEALGGASTAASSIGQVADAVGKIAARELEKMGSIAENTATKLERLAAEWINLKVAIGETANNTGLLADSVDYLNVVMRSLSGLIKNVSAADAASFLSILALNPAGTLSAITNQQKLSDILKERQKLLDNTTPLGPNEPAKLGIFAIGGEAVDKANKTRNEDLKKQQEIYQKLIDSVNEYYKAINKGEIEAIAVREFNNSKGKRSSDLLSSVLAGNSKDGLSVGIDKMREGQQNKFYKDIKIATDNLKEQQAQLMATREAWAGFGSIVSDSIAQAISANESLGRSLSKIFARMIDQLEQVTLARMVADSAKFGVGGILAAAAGFGIVKGIFGKISKASEFSSSQGFNPVARQVTFRQRGTDLVGVISETDRLNSRTRG
jgi:hypothetical protein